MGELKIMPLIFVFCFLLLFKVYSDFFYKRYIVMLIRSSHRACQSVFLFLGSAAEKRGRQGWELKDTTMAQRTGALGIYSLKLQLYGPLFFFFFFLFCCFGTFYYAQIKVCLLAWFKDGKWEPYKQRTKFLGIF